MPKWGHQNFRLIVAIINSFEPFPNRTENSHDNMSPWKPTIRSCVETYRKFGGNWAAILPKIEIVRDLLGRIAEDPGNIRTFSEAAVREVFRLRHILIAIRAGIEAARSLTFDAQRRLKFMKKGSRRRHLSPFSQYLRLYCYHFSDRFFAVSQKDPATEIRLCPGAQNDPTNSRPEESDLNSITAIKAADGLAKEIMWLVTNKDNERYSFSTELSLGGLRLSLLKIHAINYQTVFNMMRFRRGFTLGDFPVIRKGVRKNLVNKYVSAYCHAYSVYKVV